MSDISMTHGHQRAATDEPRAERAARVASAIVRICLATMSFHTEEDRTPIARQIIVMARDHGDLVGHFTAGVGAMQGRSGSGWFAGVCLECGWVGEINAGELGEHGAHRDARAHRCPGSFRPS